MRAVAVAPVSLSHGLHFSSHSGNLEGDRGDVTRCEYLLEMGCTLVVTLLDLRRFGDRLLPEGDRLRLDDRLFDDHLRDDGHCAGCPLAMTRPAECTPGWINS